ncbi:MAG: hypothetical protein GX030_00440 [Firmicutes bacterium]|nr:hypothetical protein [Bacillota bacterium]
MAMNSGARYDGGQIDPRIDRIIDVVTEMESKLDDLNRSLEDIKSRAAVSTSPSPPAPRQLPRPTAPADHPLMKDVGAMLPLVQWVLQGEPPAPEDLLQGLSALLNLRQQSGQRLQKNSLAREAYQNRQQTQASPNSLILLLVLLLLFVRR